METYVHAEKNLEDKMLLNVEKLIGDDALRIHLAQTGYECAMKRTLDIAGNQLEKLVISN